MSSERSLEGWQRRLNQAFDLGPTPKTVRGLSEELKEAYPDLRGTSPSGVQHYLKAKELYHPRRDLLTAMAKVLGVRSDWLLFDDGPMTERELEQREQAEWKKMARDQIVAVATGQGTVKIGEIFSISGKPPSVYALSDRITDALGIQSAEVPPTWIWSLIEVATRIDDPAGINVAFDRIGAALTSVLDGMGVTPSEMDDLDGFIFSIVPGLMLAAAESRRQRESA